LIIAVVTCVHNCDTHATRETRACVASCDGARCANRLVSASREDVRDLLLLLFRDRVAMYHAGAPATDSRHATRRGATVKRSVVLPLSLCMSPIGIEGH